MVDLSTLDSYRDKKAERELAAMGILGNDNNGVFKVFVNGRSFFCVASDGGGWEHVSVSPCNRKRNICPTWEEMSAIKDIFFRPDECVVEYHPPKSEQEAFSRYYGDRYAPTPGFICFTSGRDGTMTTKTAPRWCPLRNAEKQATED